MALERLFDMSTDPPDPAELYTSLDFPAPPASRPYVFINMASTADGKIVVGKPDGTARGVGGPTDQRLFRRLQKRADAVLIGATTLRAGNVLYPPEIPRFVLTHSGNIPLQNRFFTDAPEIAWALVPSDIAPETLTRLKQSIKVIAVGRQSVDLAAALQLLRQQGIDHLLCEGGGALNDSLIRAGLADELFLTLAPKLKGGSELPTIMTGQGFAVGTYLPLQLRSLYRDGDELYLRYRLSATPQSV